MTSTATTPTKRPPTARKAPRRWVLPAVLLLAGGAAAGTYLTFFTERGGSKRPDILTHIVKAEALPVAVVEKGTLESADNKDVVCKVKAGSKGTFSSTIKWVIDDGSVVSKGQLIAELDDSALDEQYKSQSIVVEKAKAEWITADENCIITVKQNESDIALAQAALKVAELDFDKFTGFRAEPGLNVFGSIIGAAATLAERGEYRQTYDDVSSRLKQAESDLEAYRERAAWTARSVKLGYLTPSQLKAEQTKLSGANDNLEKLQKEKYILENFLRDKNMTDLRSKWEVAKIGLDKALRQASSKDIQAESERRTKQSIYLSEVERLDEIELQITECKIRSPQDGMVVYYKPEQSRGGGTTQGLIAQGEQVKEGQKLMRIPDLRKMQVNVRIHEALIAKIRGDDRQSTGVYETTRVGMMLSTDAFSRMLSQTDPNINWLRETLRDREYRIARQGQRATVRVDAFPDRVFSGRVRQVAAVASQADWFSSDVKVYQTLVIIEESVEGLKPDMNAEVTIHIEDATEPVLAVPMQAIVGGAENGPRRSVYVVTPTGIEEREVTLGKFNDKMIEVRTGIKEGDEVVLNPKIVIGDKAKTREEAPNRGSGQGMQPPAADGAPAKGKKGGNPKGGAPGGKPQGPTA